jgi:hypothetical protein
MRITSISCLALLSALAAAQYSGAKPPPAAWRNGFESIREQEAKDILGYLAGKELRGRGSLSQDYWAAAGYVGNELRKMGLAPAGDNGTFFQRFEYIRGTTVPAATTLSSGEFKLDYGPDFQASHESDVDAKVRFAFLNIPEKADLSALDWNSLKGRVVLYSATAPRNPAFNAKIAGAREDLGVEAMVSLSANPLSSRPSAPSAGIKGMPDPRESQIGSIRLSAAGAKRLAEFAGASKFLAANATEASIELPNVDFSLKIKVEQEVIPLVNVLAKLDGSDPSLRKEAVVLGSHLDHVGPASDGIRYGADDNASGCTANLLIARALLANPAKPKRTVLFAFWAAEEVGTFGSFVYAMKPAIPHEDTVAYINMDMLGRNEEVGTEIAENNWNVVYPGSVLTTSRDFYDRLVANNSFVGLRFKPDKTDRTHRSDTRNFVWKSVPTVKIFTGEHPDYHRAGDTVDKINWTKLVNIAKWLYLTTADLATSADRPRYQKMPFVAPDYHVFAGRATFEEKIKLPAKSVLRVSLRNSADGKVVKTQDYAVTGNRTPYELLVPKNLLAEGSKYELAMEILNGSTLVLRSKAPLEVPATGWTRAQNVEMLLVAVPRQFGG